MIALAPLTALALWASAAGEKTGRPVPPVLPAAVVKPVEIVRELRALEAVVPVEPRQELQVAQKPPEAQSAAAAKSFDGLKPTSFLAAASPEHAPWLSKVVATAYQSKTARRVLRDVERMSAKTGRPVLVAIGEPRDWAAFDFDTQILWMPRSALRRSARNGATALAHELRHAVQLGAGLPDMFELELDAYMFDFQVAAELGDEAKKGTYDASARSAFRKSPEDFIRFLRKYYKNDVARHGRGKEYRAELQEGLEYNLGARKRALALLDRRRRVLSSMEVAGYPAETLSAYRDDYVAPIERRLGSVDRALAWAGRDLALDADPAGRRRTAAFARRAVERLRRLSGSLEVP